jgi:hypothetical protein
MLDKRYEKIRPVPVSWNGVDFKSTLEARLAILYDALRFDFTYEPLTFDLKKIPGLTEEIGREYYTPDFLVNCGYDRMIIEAKGPEPTDIEMLIARAVYSIHCFDVYIARYMFNPCVDTTGMKLACFESKLYRWIECSMCEDITTGYKYDNVYWSCKMCNQLTAHADRTPRLMKAYDTARTYNFHNK